MDTNTRFTDTLKYQKKYGQRCGDSWNMWILRKRTINTTCEILECISGYDFADYEIALYFRSQDPKVTQFLRAYETQMEDAVVKPEEFVKNLDGFYMKMCLYIESNHLYRDFFDFCNLLNLEQRLKIAKGFKNIFDAYLCLVMQQTGYFCRHRMEDSVSGLTLDGELIFCKNPHPFSDLGSYALEKYLPDFICGKKALTPDLIYKAFQPYGYSFRDSRSIEHLDTLIRCYDNNVFALIPYINEQTQNMQVDEPYQQLILQLPRIWKKAEFYIEKLQRRNYMLPVSGITMEFVNAADIWKIMFTEVIHNEQMIMLYHVFTHGNGEFSGFYNTKSQIFYSPFEFTNWQELHLAIENFILECYMTLTCDYEIDLKKNYAIRQVTKFDREFHYPFQPLALISYEPTAEKIAGDSRHGRNYDKTAYQEEKRSRNGRMRNLPDRQHASAEAQQYARDMGYELLPGKTFVRPFQYRVYCKIASCEQKLPAVPSAGNQKQ